MPYLSWGQMQTHTGPVTFSPHQMAFELQATEQKKKTLNVVGVYSLALGPGQDYQAITALRTLGGQSVPIFASSVLQHLFDLRYPTAFGFRNPFSESFVTFNQRTCTQLSGDLAASGMSLNPERWDRWRGK